MRRLLLLFGAFLAGAIFGADGFAQTNLSGEVPLTPPVYSGAPYPQSSPSVASDGDGFFAVWQDYRMGVGPTAIGTRLDHNGNPLDPGGILFVRPKPDEDLYAGPPGIVWTGTEYAVFWSAEGGTFQARVSREGEFLGSSAVPVVDSAMGGVAQVGSRTAVLTRTSPPRVAIIGSDGPLGTDTLPALGLEETEVQSLITSNGTEFVVATLIQPSSCSCIDIRLIRIRPDGTIVSTVRSSTDLLQGQYSFAASGDRYFFVTVYTRGLTGQVFDGALEPTTETMFISTNPPRASYDGTPVIADGDSFVVAWPQGADGASLMAQRYTRDGAPSGPRMTVASTTTSKDVPALARNSSERIMAVWSEAADREEFESDISARPFTPGGDSLTPGPVLISLAAPSQESPAVAFNGTNYLVAWVEQRGVEAGRRIVASRVTSSGVALDPVPLVVSDRIPTADLARCLPAVASNGRDFLVLWSMGARLFMRRLGGDGTWLDAAPILVSDHACGLSRQPVAWNGGEYFVVYTECGSADRKIVGATISSSGAVGPTIGISPVDQISDDAVVAIVDSAYLVSWVYTPPYTCGADIVCLPGDYDIVGARVSFAGAVFDPKPIQFSKPHSDADSGDLAESPAIAANGDSAVVTWRTRTEWRAARWRSSGILEPSTDTGGAILLSNVPSWANVATGWDGRSFHLFYSETSNNRDATWTLYDIAPDGPLALTTPTIVASAPTAGNSTFFGAMRTTANGGMLLAYPHLVFGPATGNVSRLFVRTSPSRGRTSAIRR